MIGSIVDLRNAARGKTVRTTSTPPPAPTPQLGSPTNPKSSSYAGSQGYIPYDAPIQTTGVMGQSYGTPTQTYAQMLAGSGSSGSGKYGGFNTEGALQNAIRGGAINFATLAPTNLRAAAQQRYADVNKVMAPVQQKITKDLFGGTIESYNQLRPYKAQLKDWYKENVTPAEDYVQTAQQIESTPISSLASQIATTRYGQSPDWATSVFKDLDTEFADYKRNQKYMTDYGMTYDTYVNQLTERDKVQGAINQAATDALEAATGLRGSYVTGVTARTPQQLQAALKEKVNYKIPGQPYEENMVSQATGAEVVESAKDFIGKRDYQSAYDMAQSLEDEGFPDTAYLIYAMLKVSGASADLKNKLALTGIVTPQQ